ncbi:MAG: YbaK/EbsC family protein [Oscillospiraceae bacterium]|nr:YbaK/EbsC family protein [Oscillospiraceae bacterium]MBR6609019.1 YbaK/EbsC family protein [Oscillospiraceae bacterium]
MSIEKVREYFREYDMEDKVLEFEVSSATVRLAAIALGTEEARIAKTMSFKKDEGCILVITAGDVKIDNAKYRHTFGLKAKMLTPDEVMEFVGHAIGGVCPFAVNEGVIGIYIDESVKRFNTIFPACGSSNSAIELTPEELFRYSKADAWVDVCKLKEA